MMKVALLSLTLAFGLLVIGTKGKQMGRKHDDCYRSWEKVGCFRDKRMLRALPELLITDRDPSSKAFSGESIDWWNWGSYLHSLACRCAQKAREKGYTMFGLQFYGECWAGPQAEIRFNKYGESNKCFEKLAIPLKPDCNLKTEDECIGQNNANYIYRLTEVPKDVDGGYSEWSSWTECSVTCGKGEQMRERSCTEPVPERFGEDCSHLGPAYENRECEGAKAVSPVDGEYSEWSEWSGCSVTCGTGKQTRGRNCTNPSKQGTRKDCVRLGPAVESRNCENPKCQPCKDVGPIDIGIALDSSGSIDKEEFATMKNSITSMIEDFSVNKKGLHVGMIKFLTTAHLEFDFADAANENKVSLKEAIEKVKYKKGWTRTDLALKTANEKLFTKEGGMRDEAKHVLVVLTDGNASKGALPYSEVVQPLREKGVVIMAVGIGKYIDQSELEEIADGKVKNVYHVDDFDQLQAKVKEMASKILSMNAVRC